ncbi:acetyl-CoA carboxylase biotin carboxyl carrier protein [uncultured Merdimonas sp.]|uniref:acetyl-CoA carboxylase biotin carboxyl carrier protein n=1 Tax=uncultured Merdimonas sp. TaxID=2023269 RepID=UPI00320A751D
MEFENLLKLIQAVSDSELTGLKYEEKGVKLHLTKEKETVMTAVQTVPACETQQAASFAPATSFAPTSDASETAGTEEPKMEGNIVTSPLVGTFYAAPAEDAEPFVTVGSQVKKGQTLAIVEAMKLMNEIESDFDGKVAEVLVENGQPVEYGQPLFRIC